MTAMGVWFNEQDWFVAESLTEARLLAMASYNENHMVEDDETMRDLMEFIREPDDKVLSIEDDGGIKTAKTCAEWAASEGKGLLCSENY